ncbi:hypothetical protein F66182_6478 [Fusarium sp. NRRL 66182]|nr:hypothetical protein F66182_6478 [Fusarium sp. NRRL 66182]
MRRPGSVLFKNSFVKPEDVDDSASSPIKVTCTLHRCGWSPGTLEYADPEVSQIRLGRDTVFATGHQNDINHPNVLRLSILRSSLEHAVSSLLYWLPRAIQALGISIAPRYFLPYRVVLKKSKPGWDKEFDIEKSMYEKLKDLQGSLIPRLFGEADCCGTRALVLSEVHGVEPSEQKPPFLQPDEFQRRLETSFRALAKKGLACGDLQLANFLIVDDRLVILDLEDVYKDTPDNIEYAIKTHAEHLKKQYERHLEGISDDW